MELKLITAHHLSLFLAIQSKSTPFHPLSLSSFKYYPPINAYVFQGVSFLQVFPPNLVYISVLSHTYRILWPISIAFIWPTKQILCNSLNLHTLIQIQSWLDFKAFLSIWVSFGILKCMIARYWSCSINIPWNQTNEDWSQSNSNGTTCPTTLAAPLSRERPSVTRSHTFVSSLSIDVW